MTPQLAAFDSRNGLVYVPNYNSNNVTVVNGTNIVDTLHVGLNPSRAVYDPVNGYVYVTNYQSSNVSILLDNAVVASVPVGTSPEFVVCDNQTGYAYVPNIGSSSVSVLNGTKLVATVDVGSLPQGGAYDPVNGLVYIPDTLSNSVSVIMGTSVVRTLSVGVQPNSATFDPSNDLVYVTNFASNNVSLLADAVQGSIPVGTGPAVSVYDSAHGYVDVANTGSNTISVLNSNSVVESVPVGTYPNGLAFDAGNGFVYVANGGSDTTSVLNSTGVVGTVNVGAYPTFITYDGSNGYVYVSNKNSANVSVIATGFRVNIAEVGLSAGTVWSARLGGFWQSSTGQAISFPKANGTYSYAIAPSNGFFISPYTGTVSVRGQDVTVFINFAQTFPLTFHETGLPSGTAWIVNLTGAPVTPSKGASSASIEFTEPNGSYTYAVSHVGADRITPSSGTATVNGAALLIDLIFTPTYNVTFQATGLPSGSSWNVTFNGVTKSAPGAIEFAGMVNGTFSYTVSSVLGYTVSPSSGSVTVNGGPMSVAITFKSTASAATVFGLAPALAYGLLGLLVAVLVVAIVIAVWMRRQRKRSAGPVPPLAPPNSGGSPPVP